MSKKKFNLSKHLYKASRMLMTTASKLNDIETLTTGSPSKIIKRQLRKQTYKQTSKVARNIDRKIIK